MCEHFARVSTIAGALMALALLCGRIVAPGAPRPDKNYEPSFVLVEQYPMPVISRTSPGTEGIEYGFEGGGAVKLEGIYHLFTTELMPGTEWVKTRIAHWTSTDRIHWRRVSTVFESSGDFTGKDPRAVMGGAQPVYNAQEGRWNLTYGACRSAPDTKTKWRTNYETRIWRAVSKQKGYGGIGGPYEDVGVILEPGAQSQPWEGLQGTDSFFPFPVGKRWLAFYGSANSEHLPIEHWRVGLAEAGALAGPWKRMSGVNPVQIARRFAENLMVTQLKNGYYVAVYDNDIEYPNSIGLTWSAPGDGIHWAPGRPIVIQPKGTGFWANTVRTPLSLIPEGNGQYTVFYTGYQNPPVSGSHHYSGVGFVTLRELGDREVGSSGH